jgi:hypothetical protein
MKKILLILGAIVLLGFAAVEITKVLLRPQRAQTQSYWVYLHPASETEFYLSCSAQDINGNEWVLSDYSPCQGDAGKEVVITQPARVTLEDCTLKTEADGTLVTEADGALATGTCSEPNQMLKMIIESQGEERPWLPD